MRDSRTELSLRTGQNAADILMEYRDSIERFIAWKCRENHLQEEMIQEIMTRLLAGKMERIVSRYQEISENPPTFSSYLLVSIRNMYIDIVRQRRAPMLSLEDHQWVQEIKPSGGEFQGLNAAMIQEQLRLFGTVLTLFHRQRKKLELCLKLKYRLPVEEQWVKKFVDGFSKDDLLVLSADFRKMRDGEVFQSAAEVFSRNGLRPSSGDSMRKWIESRLKEIAKHMNRANGQLIYDARVIENLVILYFSGYSSE